MDHDTKPETSPAQSWIHSSLIQTIRPAANLASKLGMLPHLYRINYDTDFLDTQYNEAENKKLVDICKKAEDAQIGIIALHILSHSGDENKILQMGVSKWRSDGSTQIASVHCQVEQGMTVSEQSSLRLIAGDFMFGDTEVIPESDIGPWLDATFRSFHGHEDTTCLVGHDIHRILHLVQPYWRVPSGVVILDTRALWEFQTQAESHPPLKQTLGVVYKWWDESLLGNAGNSAVFILQSLERQVTRAQQKNKPGKYMDMGMNMWRSPSW